MKSNIVVGPRERKPLLRLITVNKVIGEKWPTVFLAHYKDSNPMNNYFYVTSDDPEMGSKIAGLYQNSIAICKLNLLSLEQWINEVEFVLRDKYAADYERNPAI